jgi:glycerol uptake operon antiterminator
VTQHRFSDKEIGSIVRDHEPISSLLEQSRIIPAIRGPEYLEAALASPSVIVWLLYGTPLTLPEIVRQVRAAGKLPVANLDLLTGFAQDADGIEFLAAQGVAGVVSTRQSVLRAARAQGMIAVQRTFIVDSIAIGNIIRSLQHFQPDAIELLPAAAVPLCVSTIRTAQPQLPIIATGLVTTMRQVDDLIRCGVSSAATSNLSLWVL